MPIASGRRVFRRKFVKKRQGAKLRPTVRKTVNTMIQRKLNSNSETKSYYFVSSFTGANTGGFAAGVSATIARGTASNARIGTKIRVKMIEIYCSMNGLGADDFNRMRVAIVRVNSQTNIAVLPAVWTDVNASDPAVTTSGIRNDDFTEQYYVESESLLYTHGATAWKFSDSCTLRKVFPGEGLLIEYDISDNIVKNSLSLVAIGDSAAAPSPELSFSGRIVYKDI